MSLARFVFVGAMVLCLLGTPRVLYGLDDRRYQGANLRQLAFWIDAYYHDRHAYPTTDRHSTWFEKLVQFDQRIPATLEYGTTTDRSYPVDYYGRAIIFETPSPTNNMTVVVRSTGENGLDEQGANDDWDIRYGANIGYWHKSTWLTAYLRSAAALLLFIVGAIAILLYVRSRPAAYCLVSAYFGVLAIFLVPGGHYPVSDVDPQWLGHIAMTGQLALSCGGWTLVIFLAMVLVDRKRRGKYAKWGLCKKCGYDLRGTREAGRRECPECGTPFVLASDAMDLPEEFDR